MPVMSVTKDPTALTMKFVAEFDATLERVWQLWEDPRQLERWWGPPTYPATVTRYDFTPGGEVSYYMSGPYGDLSRRLVAFRRHRAASRHRIRERDRRRDGCTTPVMPAMIVRVVLSEQCQCELVCQSSQCFPRSRRWRDS